MGKRKTKIKCVGKIKTGNWIKEEEHWFTIKLDKEYCFNDIEYEWIERLDESNIFNSIDFI